MDEKIRELAERMLALDPNLTEREAFARARLEIDKSANIDNVTAMPNQFTKEVEEEARRLMLRDSTLSDADAIAEARGKLLGGEPYGREVLGVDMDSSVFSTDFLSGLNQAEGEESQIPTTPTDSPWGTAPDLENINRDVDGNVILKPITRERLDNVVTGEEIKRINLKTPRPRGTRYEPSFMNLPFFYGGGTSSAYRAYQLGAFSGAENMGGVQRGLGILGSAGALTLGLGREFMSGFANTRQTGRVIDDARSIQNRRLYSDNPIYRDRNALGGMEFKLGGRVVSKPDKKR